LNASCRLSTRHISVAAPAGPPKPRLGPFFFGGNALPSAALLQRVAFRLRRGLPRRGRAPPTEAVLLSFFFFQQFEQKIRQRLLACNLAAVSDWYPSPIILIPNGVLLRRISQFQRSGRALV
jgi:hypothetical protein